MSVKKITRDDILHVAQLSRLELSDDEVEKFYTQLESILGYVSKLQEVEGLENVMPISSASGLKNVMRSDDIHPSANQVEKDLEKKLILEDAPHRSGDYFKVKKVIE